MKRLYLAMAMLYAGAAGAAYKCVDENGTTLFGDTPPAGCAKVKMYEIRPGGTVIRTIEPSLTKAEVKARAEEAAKKKEADRAMGEQKRKDMALLNTYASEKEFDVARDRNIDPVKARIASATERIQSVEKRQKEIEEEMEFYKAGKSKSKASDTPKSLAADLDRVRAEKSALISSITGYEKEIEEIKAKYEADKVRWRELKKPPKTDEDTEAEAPANPAAKDAKPAAKAPAKKS